MKVKVGKPIESKAVAGPTTTAIAGYIAWALLTFVPAFKHAIPTDLQGQLPVVIAAVLASVAAYYAPHTPRPDLEPAVTPPPGVTASPATAPSQPGTYTSGVYAPTNPGGSR